MKHKHLLLTLTALAIVISGCNSTAPAQAKPTTDNSKSQVESVIESQIAQSTGDITSQKNDALAKYPTETLEIKLGDNDRGVDIDVSAMNADMTYAVVFDMMNDPNKYIGKSICIKGTSTSVFYEPTQTTYHSIIITDALACCQNGVEYACSDNNYAEDGMEVYVTGVFETYSEDIDGQTVYYIRLKDATVSSI